MDIVIQCSYITEIAMNITLTGEYAKLYDWINATPFYVCFDVSGFAGWDGVFMVRVWGTVLTVCSDQRENHGAGPSWAHSQVERAESAVTEKVCTKYLSSYRFTHQFFLKLQKTYYCTGFSTQTWVNKLYLNFKLKAPGALLFLKLVQVRDVHMISRFPKNSSSVKHCLFVIM